jgi:hypothetical protein
MQGYRWIKEVELERRDFLNIPPPGRAPDQGLDDCIGKAVKEDPRLSTGKIVDALNVGSATARNHLTKFGNEMLHVRWVLHTLTVTHKSK